MGLVKRVMVDMDNVITDGRFKEYLERYFNIKINLDLAPYAYVQYFAKSDPEGFWKWAYDRDFYDDAPLLDGCAEILEKLNQSHDVYVVTTYLWNECLDYSGRNLWHKYEYLRKMLPFIEPEKLIFTSDKSNMHFDIRIDDCLDNLRGGADAKLLFTAWHNKNISAREIANAGVTRVDSWYEIGKILLENN